MPAFFAYLIALCLLLGGGYGALNWLAAPEPVKLGVKAKSKAKSPFNEESAVQIAKASPSVASSATGTSSPADYGTVPSTSIDRPALNEAGGFAAVDPGIQPPIADPSPDQPTRSAIPKVRSDEAKGTAEKGVRASKVAWPRAFASSNAGKVASSTRKRPDPRQTSSRPEKRTLALMTLRTIQFPDGRRITQLIPYRGAERAWAFESDE